MKDQQQLESLERIYRAESRTFVRYLLEEGEAQAHSDADRKVQGFLDGWSRDSRANLERLERLFQAEDSAPRQASWPLNFSQYHFLQASYLLGPVRTRMVQLVSTIEAEAAGLADWPGAEAAVKEILDGHRAQLEKLNEIQSNLPKEDAPTTERRQTSANWW